MSLITQKKQRLRLTKRRRHNIRIRNKSNLPVVYIRKTHFYIKAQCVLNGCVLASKSSVKRGDGLASRTVNSYNTGKELARLIKPQLVNNKGFVFEVAHHTCGKLIKGFIKGFNNELQK